MITLTDEQIAKVCADEAKFRLTIMIQYLREEEKQFYLKMLHRYTNLLDFSQFCEQHNLWDQS